MREVVRSFQKGLAVKFDTWRNQVTENIRVNQELNLAKKSLEGQMEFVVSRVKHENPDTLYNTIQLYPKVDDVSGTPLQGTDLIKATITFDSLIDMRDIDGLGIRTFDTVRLGMLFSDERGKSINSINFHLKDNNRLSFLNVVGGKLREPINKQGTIELIQKYKSALMEIYALPSVPAASV